MNYKLLVYRYLVPDNRNFCSRLFFSFKYNEIYYKDALDFFNTILDLKSTKSPFKVYLNKTLPMIENLSLYWDKGDGKTKQKILGCIFTEKFENFYFESCNHIFTPEIKSIMLASKVLKSNKNKKEVKNDLLSNMAPPLGLEPRTL